MASLAVTLVVSYWSVLSATLVVLILHCAEIHIQGGPNVWILGNHFGGSKFVMTGHALRLLIQSNKDAVRYMLGSMNS